MNVLNVPSVERELLRCASYARHPSAKQWVVSVARNFILSALPVKDREANFVVYTGKLNMAHIEMPKISKLPEWALTAMERGEAIHWFDTVQVRRRNLWQAIEQIVHWFNGWTKDDKRWARVDRINFETAAGAAAMWFSNVQSNLWDFVKDVPPVAYKFNDKSGFHWVKMVTPLHFERESRLMHHCVGNGTYYNLYKSGVNEYYSLRDKNNLPHATMEVGLSSRGHWDSTVRSFPCVNQCKGKSNGRPDPRYQPYIYSFIQAKQWPIVGDQQNIAVTSLLVHGRE